MTAKRVGLSRNRIGTLLVEAGIIGENDLDALLAKQQITHKRLGELAVEEGFATEEHIFKALAKQLKIPFVTLASTVIDPSVMTLVSETMARDLRAIPLFKIEKNLTIAMADPTDSEAIKEIRFVTGCEVEPLIATAAEIEAAIDTYYSKTDGVMDAIQSLTTDGVEAVEEVSEDQEVAESEKMSQEAPIVRLVNSVIERAIAKSASDIHVEPTDRALEIRYRVDGVLHDPMILDKRLRAAVTSRLKILAKINIAERRVPQDGRFSVTLRDKKIDLRVSTFPTIHGEKVVMRILERSGMNIALDELGMNEDILKTFSQVLGLSYGIVLVTGPTGSGKTTTLYAALNSINTTEKNIVTLEDPVESQIVGVNQGHTNPVAGFTFASGLRAILRQDPDIIMVGETRDLETAEIAIQAALTGHLVFTTVHTNDAISSITRLIDMGIEPFLVSSSVSAIVAQRLVRRLCPQCATPAAPIEIVIPDTGKPRKVKKLLKPAACDVCGVTGYKGRVGLYEMVVMTDEIRRLIVKRAPEQDLKQAARKGGYRSMFEDGVDKVEQGLTSLEEVMRVTMTVLESEIWSAEKTSETENSD
jgi:type IV pilus assembly protein PilB